jgi:hypothetical protein
MSTSSGHGESPLPLLFQHNMAVLQSDADLLKRLINLTNELDLNSCQRTEQYLTPDQLQRCRELLREGVILRQVITDRGIESSRLGLGSSVEEGKKGSVDGLGTPQLLVMAQQGFIQSWRALTVLAARSPGIAEAIEQEFLVSQYLRQFTEQGDPGALALANVLRDIMARILESADANG